MSTRPFILCRIVSLFLLIVAPLSAQDYERLAPKLPPSQEGQMELPPKPPAAQGDDTKVLVKELKGLVFVDNTAKVRKNLTGISGIQADGLPLLQTADFRTVVNPYFGKPVTMRSLNTLVREIVIFYRDHDRPVVDVVVPEQEITSGVVQLVVIEATLGEVRVEGNEWFSSEFLADQVRIKPGEKFNEEVLRSDLRWINNNPFRDVNFIYTPGLKPGTADLVLQTKDRLPLRIFGGYEDSGNDLTDDARLFTGMNWGDAFGLDHQMNYQYTTNPDGKKLTAHAGSYVIPLPWRHTLTFFGSYVESSADVVAPFKLEGVSWQVSARYAAPLPDIETYRHEVVIGADFKNSNNNLEFGGTTVTNTPTDICQLVVGYDGGMKDPWGATSGGVTFFISPGGMTQDNESANFQVYQAFANADYMYGIIDFERVTALPCGFTLSNRFKYQFSNSNLLGSEQFGLGGYQTVRGYDEREANGAEGWLLSNEIRTPPISLGEMVGFPELNDQLQFLAFWDYGVTGNRTLLPGEDPNLILSGVGPGVRYAINPYLSVRFDYGFQLKQATAGRHNSRGHLGVIVAY
jgi:hemolysin activation/secretion protein